MSENCTHDCSTCKEDCSSREKKSLIEPCHELASVKRVIGVVSGKGGVGKSAVCARLAVEMRERGYNIAILDADVTGPSIPKMFGLRGNADGEDGMIFPVVTSSGIQVMSTNLLLRDVTDPVVWRGPVIAGTVKQFWTDVVWKDVDYMFVDMPPGTGDVPLTIFQSVPVDGIVIVTTPQELVSLIVTKAVKMAKMMNIPVIALVENMSYIECPDCGKKIFPFGQSRAEEEAAKFGIPLAARIPIDPRAAKAFDNGLADNFYDGALKGCGDIIEKSFPAKNQ